MDKDLEQINIAFHDRAHKLFFHYTKEFETAAASMDRKRDEYAYQQTREKYIRTLRQQLDTVAKDLLSAHRTHKQLNQIDQNLRYFINDYVHQFMKKIDEF